MIIPRVLSCSKDRPPDPLDPSRAHQIAPFFADGFSGMAPLPGNGGVKKICALFRRSPNGTTYDID